MTPNAMRLRVASNLDQVLADLKDLKRGEGPEGLGWLQEVEELVESAEWEFRKYLALKGDERALQA